VKIHKAEGLGGILRGSGVVAEHEGIFRVTIPPQDAVVSELA
jgi:hypothetical protein